MAIHVGHDALIPTCSLAHMSTSQVYNKSWFHVCPLNRPSYTTIWPSLLTWHPPYLNHDALKPPINTLPSPFPPPSLTFTLSKTFSLYLSPSLLESSKTHHDRSIRFPLPTSWPEGPRASSAHRGLNHEHWRLPGGNPLQDSYPKRQLRVPQTLRTQRCHRPLHVQVQGSCRHLRRSAAWYRTHCQRWPLSHLVRSPHLWVSHKVHANLSLSS